MTKCEARRVGDEMKCVCGLSWDVADADRPSCRQQPPAPPKPVIVIGGASDTSYWRMAALRAAGVLK